MSSGEKASKPNSYYKIGDRTVASSVWNGNDYINSFNPTAGESQAMNYLQGAIPQAYADATNGASRDEYKTNWINNQTKQLNDLANTNLTSLKDKLITGGQIGSSTGWDKIGKFSDSYTDALSEISANADTNALQYQQNLLNYANSLQGAMDNFYNLALNTSNSTAQNQQAGANQNLAYTSYNNSVANQGLNTAISGISALGSLAGGMGTLASGWGGLAKKTGG